MPDPITNNDFEEITLDQLDTSPKKEDTTKVVGEGDFEEISFDEFETPAITQGEVPTALNDDEEEQFQIFMSTDPSVLKWKSEFENQYGSFPDSESKDYDYRGAWKAGIRPEQSGTDPIPHWGSIGVDGKQLKSKDHSTRWKSDYMEALGKDPDEEGVTKIDALKALKERDINVDHLATSSELDDDEIRMSLDDLRLANPTKFGEEVNQIFKDENKYRATSDRPAEKTRDTGTIAGDVFELLGSGVSGLAHSIMGTPESVYDFLEYGAHEILGVGPDKDSQEYKDAEKLLGADALDDIMYSADIQRSGAKKLAKSEFRDWFKTKAGQLKEKANRYDKSFDYYMQTGDYGNAFGSAAYSAIESLPASIVAGFVPGGVGLVGLTSASDKKEELDKVDNVTESAKFANAGLHGISEYIFEKLGTQQLGGLVKGTFKKFGKEAATEAVQKGFKSTFKSMYKKLGLYTAPVQEGLTEAATAYSQNWAAIMTGTDPDRNPMEGVQEAFASGSILGLGGTSVQVASDATTGVKKYIGRNKDADREMFDQIAADKYGAKGEPKVEKPAEPAKKEAKIPEEKAREQKIKETPEQKIQKEIDATPDAAKADFLKEKGIETEGLSQDEISKQFETQKLGEVKPSYSIGEKTFESKEEFLTEVGKLKGKADTPAINVVNDEQVDIEVQNILSPKIETPMDKKVPGETLKEKVKEEPKVKIEKKAEEVAPVETEKTEFQVTEDQLTDDIIEKSTDPDEVAATYLQQLDKPANISHKEDIISKHMSKIKRKGYEDIGDPNNLQKVKQIIPNYFKKEGKPIDDEAQFLSGIAKVEITPQDLVDFIDKHPNGLGSIDQGGGRSSELARQFKQLTKKKLTPELAKEMTKLTPEELQQAEGIADEVFGPIKEKGVTAETVAAFEDIIPSEDVELLKEYYNARDKDETGSDVKGEARPKASKVVEEKSTQPKEEVKTPEQKDQQVIDDVNESNIQDLPPSRRVEVSERLQTNNVLTKIVSKLQKALPNVKVVMNQKAYNEAAAKFGRTDAAFVKDGVIYLDPSKTDKASAIEEFSHLWIDVAGEVNKTVLQKGLDLVKDSKYLEDVNNNPEYGDLDEAGKLKEALSKAITDQGQAIENRSAFKKFIGSFGEAVSKGLRKAGIVNRVKMFEDNLESFSKKVSKELLSEVPISQVTTDDLAKIQKGLPHREITLDKSILDPKSKGAKAITRLKAFTASAKGAGQKLLDKKNRVKFSVNAHVARANFLVDDLSKQITGFAKSLDGTKAEQKTAMQDMLLQVQELLTNSKTADLLADSKAALLKSKSRASDLKSKLKTEGLKADMKADLEAKSKIADLEVKSKTADLEAKTKADYLKGVDAITASNLPNDIKATTIRMRQQIDGLTHDLQSEGVLLDEEIVAILNQNLGVYMNRGFLKHAVENYGENFKDFMSEEQYEKAVNFIKDNYETKTIKVVAFEKTKEGIVYTFTNEAGLETKRIVKDISKMDDVFSPEDIQAITDLQNGNNKGEYVLSEVTEPQYYIPFTLTTEHLNDVIIAGIVGNNGTPSKMSPGQPQDDIGIGDKETSILQKRQDIDEPIRILLGEILDPKVNFLKSISSMASLLEKGKFEGDLVREGLGTAITEKQTAENTVRITADDSRILGEKGYWTSPEIYELLYSKQETWNNPVWNAAIMMNGMTKAALTIGKNDSQARNYWGAFANMAAAGALPANMMEAAAVSFADATNGQQIASLMSTPLALNLLAAKAFGKKNKQQIRDVFVEAVKFGLVGESVTSGVLNGILDQVDVSRTDKGIWNKVKSLNKDAVELLSKPYEASDNIFKLSHWFTEIKRFKEIYPEKSMEEIKQIAANKVRNMQPTYSITSEAVKKLSRSPLAGSFIMFTSQMYRTRLAIIKEANAEMQEGIKTNNPKLKALARKRYVGLAASMIATPLLAKVNNNVMGWSSEDDEAVAELSPSYSKNSTRFYLSRDKRNPQYMDFGFIDPSSVFHDIVIAGMRGDDVSEKFSGMFTATIEPFANQEIFTQKLLEWVNGQDQYGNSLTNDAMPLYEKAGRNLWHLTEPLIPGIGTNISNLVKGYYGYETDYGKIYDWGNEARNNILGVKNKKIDLAKKGSKQVKRLVTEMNKGRSLYTNRLKSKEVQPFSKEDRYKQTSEYSIERFRLIQKKIRALSKSYSVKEIRALLENERIGKFMIDQIMSNKFLGIDKKTGHFKKPAKKKIDYSNL